MIVSLINLQADRISDSVTLIALQETQNRVRAIAAVHESLYATEDFGTISLGPYLHHLLRDLSSRYDSGEPHPARSCCGRPGARHPRGDSAGFNQQ